MFQIEFRKSIFNSRFQFRGILVSVENTYMQTFAVKALNFKCTVAKIILYYYFIIYVVIYLTIELGKIVKLKNKVQKTIFILSKYMKLMYVLIEVISTSILIVSFDS